MSAPTLPVTLVTRDYVEGEGDVIRIGDQVGIILQAWTLTDDGRQTDSLANIEESTMMTIVLSLDKTKAFIRLLFFSALVLYSVLPSVTFFDFFIFYSEC